MHAGDGTIDFQEFKILAEKNFSSNFSDNQLMDAFRGKRHRTAKLLRENSWTFVAVFDKNGSGSFGMVEIRHVLRNLGADLSEDEMEEVLREIDIDGDDVISFKGRARSRIAQTNTSQQCFLSL